LRQSMMQLMAKPRGLSGSQEPTKNGEPHAAIRRANHLSEPVLALGIGAGEARIEGIDCLAANALGRRP
jgi:hypothetical protein